MCQMCFLMRLLSSYHAPWKAVCPESFLESHTVKILTQNMPQHVKVQVAAWLGMHAARAQSGNKVFILVCQSRKCMGTLPRR